MKTLALLAALLVGFQLWAVADIAIMPLGDSITFGAKQANAGYRYPLFIKLTQAGIGFHYLGQNTGNCTPLPYPAQQHHNGYPGATIIDLTNNLAGDLKGPAMVVPTLGGYWMNSGKVDGEAVDPDLILLMAGTNNIIHPLGQGGTDLAGMQTQFTDLIGWFTKNRPNTMILIGTVLPITRQPTTQNDQVVGFNKWLHANVASFGPKCALVDLNSKFLKPDGTINASLLSDGVHPTDAGYEAMASAWFDAINGLVSNGTLKKEAPVSPGDNFALPTGKKSPNPGWSDVKISPAQASPGATVTITATLRAGNNALTTPKVLGHLVKSGDASANITVDYGTDIAGQKLAPHEEHAVTIKFIVSDKYVSGVYDVGLIANSSEGAAAIQYGCKFTVTP